MVQGSDLEKEVAIYSSQAKSGPPLVFVNKVLLAHNNARLLHMVYDCFYSAVAELSRCDRDYMA